MFEGVTFNQSMVLNNEVQSKHKKTLSNANGRASKNISINKKSFINDDPANHIRNR